MQGDRVMKTNTTAKSIRNNNRNNNTSKRAVAEINVLNYAKAWRRNLAKIGVTPTTTVLPEQDKLLFYMVENLEAIERAKHKR